MNILSVAIDAAWLAMATYGLYIQSQALSYARRNWRVAKRLPLTHVLVMAHARLRSNAARLSIICVNALIGVAALAIALSGSSVANHQPAWVFIINLAIALGFTGNEVTMITIAQLEVSAHRRLAKMGVTHQ